MRKYILLLFVLSYSYCFSQTNNLVHFTKGDRVCFVGNSITHSGQFHHNILLYYMTRFPDQQVTFFNCGVAGDITGGILKRMDDDILIHKPTYAVIMIGMNDVQRSLYGAKPSINPDTLSRRKGALITYQKNLEKIINIFLAKNIRVILQKPTIFDQTAILECPNNLGVNDALKNCADYLDVLATKYNLSIVDYWSIMNQINTDMQKVDRSATITGKDRVHPDATGHFVMAYQFLKTAKSPRYVSKIYISKKENRIAKNSQNCTIQSVVVKQNNATFQVKENALPFPTVSNQEKGLQLVPFTDELNIEMLQVSGLKKGNFKLSIDKKSIGSYTAEQLKEGINLAIYSSTPQYQQALNVREMLEQLWTKEIKLRGIKFVEDQSYYKNCPDKKNIQVIETYLDSVFTVKDTNPYFRSRLKEYIKDKSLEAEYIQQLDQYRTLAYRLAQPKYHTYVIEKE